MSRPPLARRKLRSYSNNSPVSAVSKTKLPEFKRRKTTKFELMNSPSCLESRKPTHVRRTSSPIHPYKEVYFRIGADPEIPSDSASRKALTRTIDNLIQKIHSVSTDDLKESLAKPKQLFEMAYREVNNIDTERIDRIREKIAYQHKFKSLQFKKDVLTKKGVEKIMMKRSSY